MYFLLFCTQGHEAVICIVNNKPYKRVTLFYVCEGRGKSSSLSEWFFFPPHIVITEKCIILYYVYSLLIRISLYHTCIITWAAPFHSYLSKTPKRINCCESLFESKFNDKSLGWFFFQPMHLFLRSFKEAFGALCCYQESWKCQSSVAWLDSQVWHPLPRIPKWLASLNNLWVH